MNLTNEEYNVEMALFMASAFDHVPTKPIKEKKIDNAVNVHDSQPTIPFSRAKETLEPQAEASGVQERRRLQALGDAT